MTTLLFRHSERDSAKNPKRENLNYGQINVPKANQNFYINFRYNPQHKIQGWEMRKTKQGFVYILFNKPNSALYVGVTSDLQKRVYEHKNKLVAGFTQKYGIDKLGYYEMCDSMESAITREKYLKGKKRAFKTKLIYDFNPQWRDLYDDLF